MLIITQTALELGFLYALVAMALFLSYRILDIADLTTDGCFVLGAAVSVTVTAAGHPVLAIFAAMLAGACAGFVTAFLQTKLGVPSILAGIVTNTGLYTINLMAMGWKSNQSLLGGKTVFTMLRETGIGGEWYELLLAAFVTLLAGLLLVLFLGTRMGLSIRATGDNPDMVRASSLNPSFTITVGLCLANMLTALSGAIVGQYQKTVDINSGTGIVVILAGIVTNTGLYTINLMAMGWKSNQSLLGGKTVFTMLRETGIGGEWYELLLAAFVTLLAGLLLVLFLGTRMGLSIRATGDNPDMVRASSLNPSFTITVGLCLANMLTALSGAIVGQYQKTVDINSGTGIVVIGLACLIIGETLLGRRSVKKGVIAAILGSIVYRFIYAIVFYTKIVPVECLKLLTAIIVALAIAAPSIQKWATFQKRKMAARNKEGV